MASAARAITGDLESFLQATWGDTLTTLAQRIGQVMGGWSGVLVSTFLSAAGTALERGSDWPAALRSALDRMTFYGGATECDRTMVGLRSRDHPSGRRRIAG